MLKKTQWIWLKIIVTSVTSVAKVPTLRYVASRCVTSLYVTLRYVTLRYVTLR